MGSEPAKAKVVISTGREVDPAKVLRIERRGKSSTPGFEWAVTLKTPPSFACNEADADLVAEACRAYEVKKKKALAYRQLRARAGLR